MKGNGNAVSLHFPDIRKMLPIENETYREVADFKLSKYACYLIAMNGDPRKEVIALLRRSF